MEKFKKIILKNGMRIILAPQKDSLSTTVQVFVSAGSKYENKKNNGISHFLEHMCFKGTKKRPTAFDIASELDGMGASYNASTGHEATTYFVKARGENTDQVLDVVSDMYLNQVFDISEIEKEKGVIIEEINMIEDDPRRKIWDIYLELLYGDQPAGWDIAGTKETIRNMKREDFVNYHNEHYVASATVVVVAGNFKEKEIIEKIEKYFAGISISEKAQKEKIIEKQKKSELILGYKETDQTHLVLGVRTFSAFDERRYALDLLSDILGGGMSSRLFQRIREEMGAAYYVYAGSDFYSDHGYLAIPAGIDNNRVEEVVSAIIEEIKKIRDEKISKDELERVKERFLGLITIGLETSNRLTGFYGGQEIETGKILTPEELIKKVQAVTIEDIQNVAKEIFQNNKLNLALIGQFKEKEKLEKILNF